MPTYEIQAPDGNKYRIDGPPGATQEQIQAEVMRQNPSLVEPPKPVTAMDRAVAPAAGFNRGVASIVGIPVDTAANIVDLGKAGIGSIYTAITGKAPPASLLINEDRSSIPLSSQNIAKGLNKLGAYTAPPRPDDKASRYLYAGGAGATAGLLAPSTGGSVLPATIAGISGAESSQFAAEHGASPAVQMAAGVAGSMAPSALRFGFQEGARLLARGGEEGRQRTAQNISDFNKAGTEPSMGQATGTRRMQATETLASRAPGSAGVMARAGENQAKQIGSNIENLAKQLSPAASGEQAGRAIEKGITGPGGFLESFKNKSSANYAELDKYVPAASKVGVTNTEATLNKLASVIPGAENTSAQLVNNKIASIRDALQADLQANNQTLPYSALKQLRTIVGNELADAPFGGDIPTGQWKQIYAAMSADMEAAAQSSGPQAARALERANAFHRAGMDRIDTISRVIERNGGPEKVFNAALAGTKEGATTLRAVMQSLPQDAQKAVSAGVLRRLGRALPGQQNELGDVFSTERFLTNWNSLSPQAKATLFDRYGSGFRSDMDAVAKVAANLREGSAVFRNPSGTAQGVGQLTAASTFIAALASGHPQVAAGVAAGVGGSNLLARTFTNPNAVKWLAQSTRAPQSAIPALLARASQSNDVTVQELGKELKKANE